MDDTLQGRKKTPKQNNKKPKQTHRGICNGARHLLLNYILMVLRISPNCWYTFTVLKWHDRPLRGCFKTSHSACCCTCFQNNGTNSFHRNTIPKKKKIPRFINVMKRQLQQLVEVTLTCVCSFRQTEKWGNRHDALSQLSHNEPETKWKSLLSLMGGKCVMLLRKSWVGNIMQQRGRGKKTKQRKNYWGKYCTSLHKQPEFVELSYFFLWFKHFSI